MTNADNVMNPQYFGTGTADIRIQITSDWTFDIGGGLRSLSTVLFIHIFYDSIRDSSHPSDGA